jgi:hypothetical protein
MRVMRRNFSCELILIAVLAPAGGCNGPNIADRPDTVIVTPPADANPAECVLESMRTEQCTVDLRGRVVDFVTQERYGADGSITPIALTVRYNTAFDGPMPFPVGCPELGSFPAPAQTGEFLSNDESCASPVFPPTLVLFVDDAGLTNRVAPTAFTVPLACAAADCGGINVTLRAPQIVNTMAWRDELAEDGMPEGMSRGLALVQFLEADGAPAAGVAPTVTDVGGTRALVAGTEVRFLGTDRFTLLPATQTTTSPSGLAIVGLDGDQAHLGGTRDPDVWADTTVLYSQGWFFVAETSL